MKKSLARATAAAVSLAFAGFAQAVPLYFDFTGTVTQASPAIGLGTAVSGGFTLDTDRLLLQTTGIDNQYDFFDLAPTGLTEPLAFIDSAGTHQEIPSRALNFAAVSFSDACRPLCDPGISENITMSAVTLDPYIEGFTGQRRRSDITLYNNYWNRLPDFPFYDVYDAFDGTTAAPLDIVSMPLGEFTGLYYESAFDCVAGECTQVFNDDLAFFWFSVDTVSRGVGARAVPEPDTLGLMAAAMVLGIAVRRRRAPKKGSDPIPI
jgi:hypothetical protein